MGLRTDERDKVMFKLFYDYLKESENYKKLCEEARKHILPNTETPDYTVIDWASIPASIPNYLRITYMRYGDIHKVEFDKWYENIIKTRKRENKSRLARIEDGTDAISKDIDLCISIFKTREGREPTGLELKADLLSMLEKNKPYETYFKVWRMWFSIYETISLKDEFSKILKKDFKQESHATILERYLQVYRQKKKRVKNDKIKLSDELMPKCGGLDHSDLNDYNRYANKIIENAERGIFPGRYRDKEKRYKKQ